ncbi:MAG TPA: N-acetylmuramic acid 6-phosphate etherase, partial [Flavobacteriaceae bacterium]|nr:N-acetylmuramic acid 6-phosphate etherase [Flavobacteriaceae bacterium]
MTFSDFVKTTEQDSNYTDLEKMSVSELLQNINTEDKKVPEAVERVLPQIEVLVKQVTEKMKNGGRLFYLGAGTSGR